jgi:hypothetical protein
VNPDIPGPRGFVEASGSRNDPSTEGSTMQNLVRRSVRTTVAVAGLAALGVGLAAPAFALPGVPDVSGIGSGPTTDQLPAASTGVTKATDATSSLPGTFQFAPPSVPSAPAEAAPAESATSTESAPESAPSPESTEQAPAATTPEQAAVPAATPGVLPSIPGSPVAAQASPQVAGLPTDSAMQALDAASLF